MSSTAAAQVVSPRAGGRRGRWTLSSAQGLLWGLGFPAAVGVLWQVLADAGALSPVLFSNPSAIGVAGWQQIVSGSLFGDFAVSLQELLFGFALSAIAGIAIGVVMGASRRADYALEPLVIGLYSAPIVALYPLLIIWFGLGFTAILVLVVLFAVFPVIVNTSLGVRLVDPLLIRTARSFGASQHEILWKIVLPASIPSILTGLRLGLGRALIGVVVSELFMGQAGVGYSIGVAARALQTADVFWGILVLGVLGVGLTGLVGALERRLPSAQA